MQIKVAKTINQNACLQTDCTDLQDMERGHCTALAEGSPHALGLGFFKELNSGFRCWKIWFRGILKTNPEPWSMMERGHLHMCPHTLTVSFLKDSLLPVTGSPPHIPASRHEQRFAMPYLPRHHTRRMRRTHTVTHLVKDFTPAYSATGLQTSLSFRSRSFS